MKTVNVILPIAICLSLIALLFFSMKKSKTVEIYTYHVKSFEKTSKINYIDDDNDVYTNHIYADLYDTKKQKVGVVYSINHHRKINGVNHVTTITTYKTQNGTFTCNYYYESPEDSNYLYGKIQNVITENETGVYEGEIVHIKLEGKQDGTREIHVTY
jgi:hypothetical protein|tara:strand:- start:8583 stop:9056 length:474 start_codon:yes stop_codon:yes gene_type:complete